MQRLLGRNISVYFKGEDTIIGGILLECNDEHVYIQSDQEVVIIPKQNVKFYTSAKFVAEHTNISIPNNSLQHHSSNILPPAPPPEQIHPEALAVYVDGTLITSIPIPPTFDISVCSEEMLKVVWGNRDVQCVLRGRVQKQIEYFPGEIKITTTGQEQTIDASDGSFSMAGPNNKIAAQFLNPSEMVQRLNSTVKGRKDE